MQKRENEIVYFTKPKEVLIGWEGSVLHGICCGEDPLAFNIDADGRLLVLKPLSEFGDEYAMRLKKSVTPTMPDLKELDLPFYPGRKYKAIPDKVCGLGEKEYLV